MVKRSRGACIGIDLGSTQVRALLMNNDEHTSLTIPQGLQNQSALDLVYQEASKQAGSRFAMAVIAVPPMFGPHQRASLLGEAQQAGFRNVRLVNKPLATALALALTQNAEGNCLLYHIGGSTFNVALVQISSKALELRACLGSNLIGGNHLNHAIRQSMHYQVRKQHGYDLQKSPKWPQLLQAAEQAKLSLNTRQDAVICTQYLPERRKKPVEISYCLTRQKWEELLQPHLQHTLTCIRRSLEQAQLTADQLDHAFLLGGSAEIPAVSQLLERELCLPMQRSTHGTTSAAMGAALYAAQLAGQRPGPLLVDAACYTLSLESPSPAGAVCRPQFLQHTPLPASVRTSVPKASPQLQLRLHAGQSPAPESNSLMCVYAANRFASDKANIDLHLHMDENGIVAIRATDKHGERPLRCS